MSEGLPSSSPATDSASIREIVRPLLSFSGCALLVWLVFFGIWWSLPGIRPGHEQIYAAAVEAVRSRPLFPPEAEIRVVIFGSSQIQAGFVPDVFDAAAHGRVASYNLGLPNTTRFVDQLEILAERDLPPTHVLITATWNDASAPTLVDRLMDDAWLMEKLFPFKQLPRDAFLFFARSIAKGGPLAFYRESITNVQLSLADRGYFFIEGMSHFPGHRLPDDFRLETDDPNSIAWRKPPVEGTVSQRIRAAAERADLKIYMVPLMRRIGESADAVRNEPTAAALAESGIRVLGPDYWLLPNRFFSDPMHLNREGARCYTKLLWEQVGEVITAAPGSESATAVSPIRTRPSCN